MNNPPLLEYRNVTVCRDERVALDGITVSIEAGEHVAILGPNGCGKSTLIKTITRECYPRLAGEWKLEIMGQKIWNVFELRAMLGIVSNDLMQACQREHKGREIVLSGFFSSVGLWPYYHVTPEMERKADEVIALLEATHLADRWMDELSSGEARRFLIARALVHNPKALVLDEPTTSLDIRAQVEIRDTLRKIAAAGTGIILVTHHLYEIIPEIDRVILLKDGKVARDGAKADLLRDDVLSELFGLPCEVIERNGYYHLL